MPGPRSSSPTPSASAPWLLWGATTNITTTATGVSTCTKIYFINFTANILISHLKRVIAVKIFDDTNVCVLAEIAWLCASWTAAPASWQALPSSPSWASCPTSKMFPSPKWQSPVRLETRHRSIDGHFVLRFSHSEPPRPYRACNHKLKQKVFHIFKICDKQKSEIIGVLLYSARFTLITLKKKNPTQAIAFRVHRFFLPV